MKPGLNEPRSVAQRQQSRVEVLIAASIDCVVNSLVGMAFGTVSGQVLVLKRSC